MAEIVHPDKQRAFQNVNLSPVTITRREEEIGSDIKNQLNSAIQKYVPLSLSLDESQFQLLQLNFLFLSEE